MVVDIAFSSLTYECPPHRRITSCAFSQCGKYFAIVEDRSNVYVYEAHQLLICSGNATSNSVAHANTESSWRYNDVSVDIMPIVVLDVSADISINYIAFGDGEITRCRLPHRLTKRRSVVTRSPDQVCIIAVAKSNGYIDVYNLNLLRGHYSPILAKMVLFDGRQSILHLNMSTDGALRLASINYQGVVKLWDIWDDGNMYVTLTSPGSGASFINVNDLEVSKQYQGPYNYHVVITAWHPFEGHLFLGDRQGHGLVLQDEHPYRCLHLVHHYHRISGATYSNDGDFLLTASFDGRCILWSVPSYTRLHSYSHIPIKLNFRLLGGANDFHITSLALAPDSESFATFCEDGNLRLWPLSPTMEPRILMHEDDLDRRFIYDRIIVFSPCGRFLACSLGNRRLQLWNQMSCMRKSLVRLCVASIRRCVVSSLLTAAATPSISAPTGALSALSALPLPWSLRCLLCHNLKSVPRSEKVQ